jgi:hypothetical protein
MAHIAGEVTIDAPVDDVFDMVADERNEPRYNPRIVRAEKVSEGPVGRGARFVAEPKSMGAKGEMTPGAPCPSTSTATGGWYPAGPGDCQRSCNSRCRAHRTHDDELFQIGIEQVAEVAAQIQRVRTIRNSYDIAVVLPGLPHDPAGLEEAGATWVLVTGWLDDLPRVIAAVRRSSWTQAAPAAVPGSRSPCRFPEGRSPPRLR